MASTSRQQPHVVQAIFDSVTRCFNPIDDQESPFTNRCPRQSPHESPNPKTTPRGAGAFDADKKRSSSSSGESFADVSRTQYDADRYIRRKLEIFRTTDKELAEMGLPPRRQGHQARSSSRSNRGHTRNRSDNTLAYSSDDEIAHLTRNQHRKKQDGNNVKGCNAQNDSNPIAAFARILRDPFSCISEVQKPLGLCFATPIRASSAENVANMSDWKLTSEEFAARHQDGGRFRCNRLTVDVPDVDESSASCEEEETITSASYFEQKYSHLIETNPPMPLYPDQRIAVSEFETEEIFKMIKRRHGKAGTPPRSKPISSRDKSPHPRSSPTRHIIVKKNSSVATPRMKGSKSSYSKGRSTTSQKKNRYHDSVPVGKSSSVSTEAGEQPPQMSRLREPDIVHCTAAEI